MAAVTYRVVEHDGGWAYQVGDVFSGVFPTHAEARRAAQDAAQRQQQEGTTTTIEYEDEKGEWHSELATRTDRPDTAVEDTTSSVDPEPRLSSLTGAREPVEPPAAPRR